MRILAAWKSKTFYGILAAIGVFTVPILVTLFAPGGIENWIIMIGQKPENLITAIFFSLTFGSFVALYTYNKATAPACCKAKTTNLGLFGGVTGALLGKCPACFSILAFILPALGIGSTLSVTVFFGRYAWAIMLASIMFIIYSIYKMEGFKVPYSK